MNKNRIRVIKREPGKYSNQFFLNIKNNTNAFIHQKVRSKKYIETDFNLI